MIRFLRVASSVQARRRWRRKFRPRVINYCGVATMRRLNIGYDLLTHYWARVHNHPGGTGQSSFEERFSLEKLEELAALARANPAGFDADAYQQAQSAAATLGLSATLSPSAARSPTRPISSPEAKTSCTAKSPNANSPPARPPLRS